MIHAVKAGDPAQADQAAERLAAIRASAPFGASDDIALAEVARLTSLSEGGGDSLHRLVMDLHKALNRLAAAHAEEVLAGAHVSALVAGRSAGGRSVHARGRGDREAQVRPSRTWRRRRREPADG